MQKETKRCVMCGEVKYTNAFYQVKGSDDGYHRYCRKCCKVNRALESVRRRDRKTKISQRQKYRAQTLGIECDVSINLAAVFKRDFGVCKACGDWVQPKHASMDHRIPLARGGTHTWGNIQLMHLICNLRKGHRDE
jgi:5-methylcytosine-specific restriction endonuclease McrA